MPLAELRRCAWATKPATIAYHDREWGVPTHDDRALFEYLVLEGAQAGLSWDTILAKRERYREVFAHFDRDLVARFEERDVARLVLDAGIVRHRGKIESAIANAKAARSVAREHGSFDAYVWSFVDGVPLVNAPRGQLDVPATTPLAQHFSRDLRARGFSFVGPTIVYAFMQAAGLVNDHLTTCFRSTCRA